MKNVLAPKSVEDFVNILNSPEKCSQFYSVTSDASNKGNRKMIPICVRYFDPSEGIENKLLSVFEWADETAHPKMKFYLKLLKVMTLIQITSLLKL